MKGDCACGRPVHTKGICKRCYERRWRAKHPEYVARLRSRHAENFNAAPDPLTTLLNAFGMSREELGGYFAVLRGYYR